ncbi:interferon phi 1 isoform X1 [Triplophysa rosa]|uniref:Interferon n=1 Tax=Triplophysa rosa TaxID=992332 RepID=A0A9W7WKN9_TRIRA|nr:interferon phi 1 isoform X1 [Triplophysa rosa]KAI7803404.1 interferon [Triplophysa rosa]
MCARMKQTKMWTYIFVTLLTLQSQCSACEVLRRYRLISNESLTLLLQMGADHPTQRVPFPGSLYKYMDNAKVEDQVRFLTLTLDHIIDLMDAKEQMSSVKWNPKTVDNFLNVLHRQSSDLKECAARYQKASHTSYERRIKRHFKVLKKILKKKEYSAWAWEQIRRAVRSHLQRMDIMTSNAKTLLRL